MIGILLCCHCHQMQADDCHMTTWAHKPRRCVSYETICYQNKNMKLGLWVHLTSSERWCNEYAKEIIQGTWIYYLRFMPSKLANIIFLSTDVMVEDALVATSRRKQWRTPCESTYTHAMAFHRSYSFTTSCIPYLHKIKCHMIVRFPETL